MSNSKTNILAVVIIFVTVLLAITSLWDDSLIVDEVPHIGAGYSYLVKQDLRLNPEHPPLAKDLAALPLLFLKLKQNTFETSFWKNNVNGQWEFGQNLIYHSGNNANQISHFAKLAMLSFFVLAAILTFRWAQKLYGNIGGLTALILFTFSPTILAHARFVTTDVPALFGVLLSTYFFINYLQQNTRKSFWLAGLSLGVALLTKFSAFLLIPYFLILALVWGLTNANSFKNRVDLSIKKIHQTVLIFIVSVSVVVWPVYFFNTFHYPPSRQKADTAQLLQTYAHRTLANLVIWSADKPIIRALSSYGLGFLMVNQRAAGGNTTYFLGEVSRFGWKHYFPIVYFMKEPLAWWGLVIIALGVIITQISTNRKGIFFRSKDFFKNHFTEFAMLFWLLIYWSISVKSTLNIGVRHLLPTYPFAILLVSGQLKRIFGYLKQATSRYLVFLSGFLVFFLLTWYVTESIKIHPYYLTYFNQIVGGPAGGHRYVVDSNLDWGQDLKRFSRWVEQNNLPKIELDYFGWADPAYYLGHTYEKLSSQKYKNAEDFRARNKTGGWMAVSATFLQGSQGPPDQFKSINYLWLKNYQPVVTIGHSIFVYQIK